MMVIVGVYIDKTPPSCSTSGGSDSWTTGSRTLVGKCSDSGGSGCQGNVSTLFNWTINEKRSSGRVYDNAGNSRQCPNATVKIDKIGPQAPWYGGTTLSSKYYTPTISYNNCWNEGGNQENVECRLEVSVSRQYGYFFDSKRNWSGDVGIGTMGQQQDYWTHNGGNTDNCPYWFVGDCGKWQEGDCRACATWAKNGTRFTDKLGNAGNELWITYNNNWY